MREQREEFQDEKVTVIIDVITIFQQRPSIFLQLLVGQSFPTTTSVSGAMIGSIKSSYKKHQLIAI